jgi:ATP-dependent protease ClpP protease subunit
MPAISTHHTATVDEAWDGPAAVSAMPSEYADLHYCHAWWSQDAVDATPRKAGDDDADDKKSNYKFPHHKSQGGPANIPACRNGLARLEGSSIPDGDKAGVKAHLQAHIDDFNKKSGDSNNRINEPGLTNFANYGRMDDAARLRAHIPRAHKVSNKAEFFRITNATMPVATLDLYDEIGFWGINASDFKAALDQITARDLTVRINSPGGDVFDGIAILNLLRSHSAKVHTIVDGMAASAASFIAMAGDVTMMPNSQMMIHDALGLCVGNQAEMLETAALLDKASNNIADIYQRKAGGTVADWRAAMQTETWYGAQEAVDAGLADRVGDTDEPGDSTIANHWRFDLYNHAGRSAAPAPQPIARAASPVDTESDDLVWDPEVFRSALKLKEAAL